MRDSIDVTFGPEFHMAHELASPFQQAARIIKFSATKKPDIDMSFEGIDIAECCITYARGWMARPLDPPIDLRMPDPFVGMSMP